MGEMRVKFSIAERAAFASFDFGKKTMKHYKYDKIRVYERRGRYNVPLLSESQKALFSFAKKKGYLVERNDAPRNAKVGLYYEVLKYFDEDRLEASMNAERRRHVREMNALNKARKNASEEVLKSNIVELFSTISDVGKIIVNDTEYSNFYGKGTNTVEICTVDGGEFKQAKYLTRRQIFNPEESITIEKFASPRTLEVKLSDVDVRYGSKEVKSALGFVIWSRKMKIYIVTD